MKSTKNLYLNRSVKLYREKSSVSTQRTFSTLRFKDFLINAESPNQQDRDVISQRHFFGKPENIIAVEKTRCKHGFPRAFACFHKGDEIASGNVRLSCPYLVKAIDAYEKRDGIQKMNKLLQSEDKKVLSSFTKTNHGWRDFRKSLVTDSDFQAMVQKFGAKEAAYRIESGLIGISIGSLDVKCLHAQVADHLLRTEPQQNPEEQKQINISRQENAIPPQQSLPQSYPQHSIDSIKESFCIPSPSPPLLPPTTQNNQLNDTKETRDSNLIGQECLRILEENEGISPRGSDTCWQQCDLKFNPTKESFWYVPKKNKLGRRLSRRIYQEMKKNETTEILEKE